MRIVIHAVGRLKAGPERELLDRYLARAQALAPRLGWSAVMVREVPEGRAASADARRADETSRLLANIPAQARVVALDERGGAVSSADFASWLGTARDAGVPEFACLIGGADGLAPAAIQAGHTLAFGRLTLPHQLVRILLAEQLYRAATILTGHPYHRA